MDELEKHNIYVSHETIRKVLHQEGLIDPYIKEERHAYRRFEAEYRNQMWQTDILYCFVIGYGYYYLTCVMDDYSRKIVGWRLSAQATALDCI